jgi:hypothetical protein
VAHLLEQGFDLFEVAFGSGLEVGCSLLVTHLSCSLVYHPGRLLLFLFSFTSGVSASLPQPRQADVSAISPLFDLM